MINVNILISMEINAIKVIILNTKCQIFIPAWVYQMICEGRVNLTGFIIIHTHKIYIHRLK